MVLRDPTVLGLLERLTCPTPRQVSLRSMG